MMFGSSLAAAARGTVLALTLTAGLAAGATPAAAAAVSAPASSATDQALLATGTVDATFLCAQGVGAIYFGLPWNSVPRMSLFAYRVDGGSWQATNWYYTNGGRFWTYEGGQWLSLSAGSSMAVRVLGGGHRVDAFEYRIDVATGRGGWVPFASCTTTDVFGGIPIN